MTAPELRTRAATVADLPAVLDLVQAVELAEMGQVDSSIDDLRTYWEEGNFDPATDTLLVVDPADALLGYSAVWDEHGHAELGGDLYVRPDQYGHGIEDVLQTFIDRRGLEHVALADPDAEVTMTLGLLATEEAMALPLARSGYEPARWFWRMAIDLTAAPPAAHEARGVTLRAFDRERDAVAVHEAMTAAFSEHWGSHPVDFAEWSRRQFTHEGYRPELWHVAEAGGDIAGALLGFDYGDRGWIRTLGVLDAYRGRGVGLALLHRSFTTFREAGKTRAELAVDSDNATGATRLYERAGMHNEHTIVLHQKVLRPAAG